MIYQRCFQNLNAVPTHRDPLAPLKLQRMISGARRVPIPNLRNPLLDQAVGKLLVMNGIFCSPLECLNRVREAPGGKDNISSVGDTLIILSASHQFFLALVDLLNQTRNGAACHPCATHMQRYSIL
jgi:hypothetical protein